MKEGQGSKINEQWIQWINSLFLRIFTTTTHDLQRIQPCYQEKSVNW